MTARKSRKHQEAIAALLGARTIADAARATGIGEKTLRRWLSEPDFQDAYRSAREEAVRGAVGRLQALLSKATETLERALSCGKPAVELRAAVAAFEQAYKGTELLDLADRIAALEKRPT